MNYKVLYAEDEPFLAHIVSDGLTSSGYTVTTISDGMKVMEAYTVIKPDICVLDIMLPGKDGYQIAAELRASQSELPIIFLSAKTLTEDIIKGFRSGGNDYLKKPFSIDELLIRMEALLSRFNKVNRNDLKEKQTIYHFGACQLDIIHQKLKTSTGIYPLSFKEMALLEMMIIHQNTILERQRVLIKIWGEDSYYNTRSMDVFMTHLRKLLKNEPAIEIMNIRGIGYKFIC